MPPWVWVVIAVGVVAVLAFAVVQMRARKRTERLRGTFGPEYDRVARGVGDRREAEAELAAREERREQLDIRPLPERSRLQYAEQWRAVQAEFVDDPRRALARADELIQAVMADRGYPMQDFDQRAADVSVDHPQVVENYREGHRLARAAAIGDGTTESLRQAMQHYRALFDELLEESSDAPIARDPAVEADRPSVRR
jgi:hypothetical protein